MLNAFMALASDGVLASGGFEAPSIDEFFPNPIFFGGTPFAINRVVPVRLVTVAVLFLLYFPYYKKAKLIPNRAQGASESIPDFSRNQAGHEIPGKRAKPYRPLLAAIFIGSPFIDTAGTIPGLQAASTSIIGMPLTFAIVAYVSFLYVGIKVSSAGHFLKERLFPPGVPKPIYIFVTPVELFLTLVIRPLMLAIRLLAGMVSGHLLPVLCFLETHYLYLSMSGGTGIALDPLALAAGIVFILFEAFVAVLQAYIFALLIAAYISLSVEH